MILECGCEPSCCCAEKEKRRIACLSDDEFIWELGKKTWLHYNSCGKDIGKAYANINEFNQWWNKAEGLKT